MILRWLLASLHILALPLGLTALWFRERSLRNLTGTESLRAVFLADNCWGTAALLWLGTGLARLLAGTAVICRVQAVLIVLMAFAATAVARGFFY
jgi:putative membrane protein